LSHDHPPIGVAAVATGAVCAAAAVREYLGLPGITPDTALRCHDKLAMKKAIAAAGIPCAPWREITTETSADELVATLGLPLVLKMPISSGGRGVWICKTAQEVAAKLRPGLLAEGFVCGTEMSIETLRHDGTTIFRNPTRYLKPRWANVVPAVLDTPQLDDIDALNERVHTAIGISDGISHMEIFLTPDGPVFGEIAARPPGGYIMELIRRAYGFNPWTSVLSLAVGKRPVALPDHAGKTAGVWLIHPTAGQISEVLGLDKALSAPEIISVSCRLRPGDVVPNRVGSGDSKGKIIAEAPDHRSCVAALEHAADTIQILLTESLAQC
ncbi:MAG: biotin carboxylase, partial [Verrucomicrobiales bacterium]